MAGISETPSLWILGALIAYAFTYFIYARWVDQKIWEVKEDKPTPAHMYMDGVEFFPVSRYVLYGFQFKSIAALGPILGPFIGVTYGWVPALIWIILGNMFVGWVQDYSAIMLTVRNEGKSMGPLVYEYLGEQPRKILLAYLLFYLLIISAVFIYLIGLFWTLWVGSFVATLIVMVTALIVGQLLYKYKINIFYTVIIAIILVIIAVIVGTGVDLYLKAQGMTKTGEFWGGWSMYVWAVVLAVFLFIAAIVSMPKFITPLNFVAFFPAIAGVIFIIIAALVSPFTGVKLIQSAWNPEQALTLDPAKTGPIFPVLFVAIACGAISGWHSLVGTSTTGKQLDVETDARPVGAGAMLTEGLLATSALAAYMVVSKDVIAKGKIGAFISGAVTLTNPIFGGGAADYLAVFYALFLVIYAFTVQILVTRYWRIFSAELFREGALSILGDKYVATFIGLLIPIVFALSGSWINLWIYFGGSNQLLASLALMLVAVYLAKVKRPSWYAFIPAVFMTIVTLSAIFWEIVVFTWAVATGHPKAAGEIAKYPSIALALNAIFIIVGVILFILGIIMSYYLYSRFFKFLRGEE